MLRLQGDVRFEDTFDATECNCVAANTDIVPGSGSALYNAEGGNVAFRKRVSISDCGLFVSEEIMEFAMTSVRS